MTSKPEWPWIQPHGAILGTQGFVMTDEQPGLLTDPATKVYTIAEISRESLDTFKWLFAYSKDLENPDDTRRSQRLWVDMMQACMVRTVLLVQDNPDHEIFILYYAFNDLSWVEVLGVVDDPDFDKLVRSRFRKFWRETLK